MAVLKYKTKSGQVQTMSIPITQIVNFPEPSEDYEGKIYQYIGETNDNYTNGYFYKCINNSELKEFLLYSYGSKYLYVDKNKCEIGDYVYNNTTNQSGQLLWLGDFTVLDGTIFASASGKVGLQEDFPTGYAWGNKFIITSVSADLSTINLNTYQETLNNGNLQEDRISGFSPITKVSDEIYYHGEVNYQWLPVKVQAGGGSGGTDDYNDLEHKPKINGVTLNGDKTLEDLGIDLSTKVDIEQGIEAAGKILKVNDEGNLELAEDAGGSEVSVSATGSSTNEVKYITIDDVEYKLAGSGSGSEVIANPEEEATDTLTTIKINEKVYDLGVGGLSVAVEKINNKNTLIFNNSGSILPSNDKPIVVALGTNASSLTAIPSGAKKLIIIAGQSNFDEFEGVAVVDLQELSISGVSLEVEKEWFNKIDIYSTMDEAQNNDTFTKVTDSQYKYYWKDSNNSNYGTITIMIYSNIMFTITNSFGTNSAIVYWE